MHSILIFFVFIKVIFVIRTMFRQNIFLLSKFFIIEKQQIILFVFLTVFFSVIILMLFENPLFIVFAVDLILFFIFWSLKFYLKFKKNKVEEIVFLILSKSLIFLKTGDSFSLALKKISLGCENNNEKKILKLMQNVEFVDLNSPVYSSLEVFFVVVKAKELRSQCQLFLQSYLESKKISIRIRHRSGQIMSVIYIQLAVIGFLYLAISIYTFIEFNIKLSFLHVLSFVWFILGFYLTLIMGRKIKWSR